MAQLKFNVVTRKFDLIGLDINSSGNLDLPAGANITVDGSDPYRPIVLTGAGGTSLMTAGCSQSTTVETTVNKNTFNVLPFPKSVKSYGEWTLTMPNNYDGGQFNATVYWTTTGASASVVWGIQGAYAGNGASLDSVSGTPVNATSTYNGTDWTLTSISLGNFTVSGASPAGGGLVQFKIFRDGTSGSDNLAKDAHFLFALVQYGVNAYSG